MCYWKWLQTILTVTSQTIRSTNMLSKQAMLTMLCCSVWSTADCGPMETQEDVATATVNLISGVESTREAHFTPPLPDRPGDIPTGSPYARLGCRESASFPTWSFWGTTRVHMNSVGNVDATVSLQVGSAGAEYHSLPVGADKRVGRRWAGFPVTVTNTGGCNRVSGEYPIVDVWAF